MIDNILGNRTNILVLRFLSKFDNQFFLPEEIAGETGAGLRNIHGSLRTLSYERILTKEKKNSGKVYYKFVIDSLTKELIYRMFDEEKKRLSLRNIKLYKVISEVESRITKIIGLNLVDVILFGSVAKGRDTVNSDLDFCILLAKKDNKTEQKVKKLALDNKFPNEIQIHTLTLDEFMAGYKNKNPLIGNIVRDGISLKMGK